MAKKTVTIRLSEEAYEYVASSSSDSINKAIEDALITLKSVRIKSIAEIKDIFSNDELGFLEKSMAGVKASGPFRVSAGALIANFEPYLDVVSDEWIKSLTSKITSLKGANIEALHLLVEKRRNGTY